MTDDRLRRVHDALAAAATAIVEASGYPDQTVKASARTLVALGEAVGLLVATRDIVAAEIAAGTPE